MGILRRKGETAVQTVFLEGETVVGRWSGSHLRIDRSGVSAQHATIRWTSGGWVLRDLGSRNGTLHNGEHVAPKTGALLRVDDALTFGELDEVWIVDSVDPPGLILRPTEGDADEIHVSPHDGLKALPSPEQPAASLFYSGDGCWYAESTHGERTRLADGALVELLQRHWRCVVPAPSAETSEPNRPIDSISLATIELTIAVATDEETATVHVRVGGTEHTLGPSVPLYLLAFLARERRADPGWVGTEHACKELQLTREQLAVQVYRVREAVKAAGVAGATDIIERKRGWLRIGVEPSRVRVG